jgi:hypothetical protein
MERVLLKNENGGRHQSQRMLFIDDGVGKKQVLLHNWISLKMGFEVIFFLQDQA